MNAPSPEQTQKEGPYTMVEITPGVYSAHGPTTVNLWFPSKEAGCELACVLNAAHVQAQAAPLAQGLVDAGDAMRDELQKKVVLDRLTNDKFPGSAECVISRWTQAKASTLPVADGEKERSGPSVEEVMEALRLAIKYIKESPCDPDIYDEQIKAWLALNDNPIAAELLSQER